MDLHPFRRSLFKERQHLKRPFLLFPKMPSAFVGAPTLKTYICFGVLLFKERQHLKRPFLLFPKTPSAFVGPRLLGLTSVSAFFILTLYYFSLFSFYIYLNSIAYNFYKFNQNLTERCIYDIISVANSYKKCINCAKFGE